MPFVGLGDIIQGAPIMLTHIFSFDNVFSFFKFWISEFYKIHLKTIFRDLLCYLWTIICTCDGEKLFSFYNWEQSFLLLRVSLLKLFVHLGYTVPYSKFEWPVFRLLWGRRTRLRCLRLTRVRLGKFFVL